MIKIALTNLGKYNEGELVFEWLSLPATEEEIEETLEKIGINEEYEEYFITDYESEIYGLTIGEYENLESLNELAERIDNLDDYDKEALYAVMEAAGHDLEGALEIIESGDYSLYSDCEDLSDLAYHFVDEGYFGDTKQMGNLVNYIDYEALGRDLGFDGYHETSKGVIHLR